jgi:hypothetical protein
MDDDWLDTLLGGSLELGLPRMTISQGNTRRFVGHGRVSWRADAPIRVVGVTDGTDHLWAQLGRSPLPGRLIPLETYIVATGDTQRGWRAETVAVPMDGTSINSDSPDVEWDFTTRGLTLSRDGETWREGRTIRAILGPPPDTWIRATETVVHNELFPNRLSSLDWLVAQTRVGPVAARRRTEDWFEVKAIADNAGASSDVWAIVHAAASAFAFAFGRRVVPRGYEDVTLNVQTRFLAAFRRRTTAAGLLAPIGRNIEARAGLEHLIGRAIDYFLTPVGQRVVHHLSLCWDVADNWFSTRQAVVCIGLEGLLRIASPDPGHGDPGFTAADVEAARAWLRGNAGILSPRFAARLGGLLGTLSHRRPVDVLRDWAQRGILGVTSADIEAWNETRNAVAHARMVGPAPSRDELQSQTARFDRLQNLMNRIVLQLMGYDGPYVDYSTPGYQVVAFRTAPADAL